MFYAYSSKKLIVHLKLIKLIFLSVKYKLYQRFVSQYINFISTIYCDQGDERITYNSILTKTPIKHFDVKLSKISNINNN